MDNGYFSLFILVFHLSFCMTIQILHWQRYCWLALLIMCVVVSAAAQEPANTLPLINSGSLMAEAAKKWESKEYKAAIDIYAQIPKATDEVMKYAAKGRKNICE